MVHGALAWWLWDGAHVLFLVGGRNRTAVLIDWIWAYLTYRRASRLITDRSARFNVILGVTEAVAAPHV